MQLSIIVPIYNEEKYLKRCINSILSQTYNEFELILIDDGSKDMSGYICDEYAKRDERIRVVHQVNKGLIATRFVGVSLARGKYLAFVDSDDWIDADMFEILMKPLTNYDSIDVSITPYTWGDEINQRSRFQPHEETVWSAKEGLIRMLEDKFFGWSVCGKVYKKVLFNNLQIWYIDNSYGEDLEISWKLFQKAEKIYFQPALKYHYFNNLQSMTHRSGNFNSLRLLDRLDKIIGLIPRDDTELYKICAYTFCTKILARFIEYLLHKEDNSDVTKYQTMIQKHFSFIQDELSDEQKERCQYALLNKVEFQNKMLEREKGIITAFEELRKKCYNIFIYGAGEIATDLTDFLKQNRINFSGYVISGQGGGELDGKPIYSFSRVWDMSNGNCGFILAMDKKNSDEVKKFLKDKLVDAYIDVGIYFPSYLTGSRYMNP